MPGSDIAAPAMAGAIPGARPGYLFGPILDFVALGGSFLLLLPLFFLLPAGAHVGSIATVMVVIANFVNHPHFAHSYQIFYRNFDAKTFGADYDRIMRARYLFAGIVVPLLLAAFFVVALAQPDARLLGYGGNLMVFFVGWHYVKQGYGMLMVDAALKKRYFPADDKKVFLINAYAIWAFQWLYANTALSERTMWGLTYYSFHIPAPLLGAAGAVALATSAMTLWTLVRRWRANGGALPANGVVAYLVTLYGWGLFLQIVPVVLLVVPALHSLQYLVVVWRHETNYAKDKVGGEDLPQGGLVQRLLRKRYRARVARFILVGGGLGFLGFWGLPLAFQAIWPINEEIFGASVFLFVFWIFINVHHYFMDNVMWRRENPDTRRYLFG